MGYITRKIVKEKAPFPTQVSLSGLSNFLILEGLKDKSTANEIETKIKINKTVFQHPDTEAGEYIVPETQFTIFEKNDKSQKHTFQGTYEADRVNDTTFLLVKNDSATVAENIRSCLLKNTFFRSRFDISIPLDEETPRQFTNGDTIIIRSLGTGDLYEFTFDDEDDTENNPQYNSEFVTIEGNHENSNNDDLIDRGMGNVDIEAEVYTDTGIFLGVDDAPVTTGTLGRHVATMSKAYFGQDIWFDVNALMNVNKTYSDDFLRQGEKEDNIWVDAGTINDLRLVMKKHDGASRETFYYSNVQYAVTGYARTLDQVNLDEDYVYSHDSKSKKPIKPLTNQPVLPHIKGQVQYFNFIFKDPDHNDKEPNNDYRLGIRYDLYTQSGKYIESLLPEKMFITKGSCHMVNNILLNIDEVIEEAEAKTGKKVGTVKASLCRNNQVVSQPLEFSIMPECLHDVSNFAFLNSLGGWSSFSFGGESATDTKASANTIYSTQLPGYTVSSRIESVFDKEIKETYSVKTLPVNAEVAEWLREIASSVAVYELATKRYIIVDDFNIKHNTTDRLFTLEMKYHYSDTYNAVIK